MHRLRRVHPLVRAYRSTMRRLGLTKGQHRVGRPGAVLAATLILAMTAA